MLGCPVDAEADQARERRLSARINDLFMVLQPTLSGRKKTGGAGACWMIRIARDRLA